MRKASFGNINASFLHSPARFERGEFCRVYFCDFAEFIVLKLTVPCCIANVDRDQHSIAAKLGEDQKTPRRYSAEKDEGR